jgi:hypothetical protein
MSRRAVPAVAGLQRADEDGHPPDGRQRTGPDGTITMTTDGERFARDVAPVLEILVATGH